MDPVYAEELLIDLNVNNNCKFDVVTTESMIDDQLYYIDVNDTVFLEPTWSSNVTGCPATYEIGRVVDGVERPLTPEEYVVISHSVFDGHMSYFTEEFDYDGEVWTIRLYRLSTYSSMDNDDGEYLFDIEFRDECWDSVLQPAVL